MVLKMDTQLLINKFNNYNFNDLFNNSYIRLCNISFNQYIMLIIKQCNISFNQYIMLIIKLCNISFNQYIMLIIKQCNISI